MSEPTKKIEELIELLMSGRVDVLECQRAFQRDARWVAKLIDSAVKDRPWSAVLLWVPDETDRPSGGRYQAGGDAEFYILDGGQRLTALIAALGKRPPWIPIDEWIAMGGPALAVSVGISRDDEIKIRPTASSTVQGDIPLGDLLAGGSIEDLVEHAGLAQRKGLVEKLAKAVNKIKSYEVHVEWVRGVEEHAQECFLVRNEKSQQMALKSEQFRISLLACRFRPLQRDLIDPLLRHAEAHGMGGKVINLKSVDRVMQHLLPSELRGGRCIKAEPGSVEETGYLLVKSTISALIYLERIGIVHEDLVPYSSMIDVMVAMIARYPAESMADGFLAQWLTHMVASEVFRGARSSRVELKELEDATNYQQAKVGISVNAPDGPPSPFVRERVVVLKNGRFSTVGCLIGLASAARTTGSVVDLFDDSVTFPHRSMTFQPLTVSPIKGYTPHYALMTSKAAQVIRECGGWTRLAYERLRPSPQVLEAHNLPEPPVNLDPKHVDEFLDTERRPRIAEMINSYLSAVPLLPGREGPAQGDLFQSGGEQR